MITTLPQGVAAPLKLTDEEGAHAKTSSADEPLFPGPNLDAPVSMGTTIMALSFPGGVVLAADTRTSSFPLVANRAARKITQLHNRIFMCRSGVAADTQALSWYLRRYLASHAIEQDSEPTVQAAASLARLLCYNNKGLVAGLIIAGYDDRRGGQVFQIPVGGAKIKSGYAIGGSGSRYISALLHDQYRPDFTKEECVAFCKRMVKRAISEDASSGGLIRLYIVTKESVEEMCVINDEE